MGRETISSLVLGNQSIEWTVFRHEKTARSALGSGRIPLTGELFGEAEPEESVYRLAGDQIKRQMVERTRVTIGLPSDVLLLRVVSLPAVEDVELSSMVRLQADKFSPFSADSMVVSYEILHKSEKGLQVLVAAVRQSLFSRIDRLLASAGVVPGRVDVTMLGRLEVMSTAGKLHDQGWHMVLIVDEDLAELVVMRDGVPVSFRSLGNLQGLNEAERVDEISREVGMAWMSVELEQGDSGAGSVSIWHSGPVPAELAGKIKQETSFVVTVHSLDLLPAATAGLVSRSIASRPGLLDLTPGQWVSAGHGREFRRKMLTTAAVVAGIWLIAALGLFAGLFYQEQRLKSLKATREELNAPAMEVRSLRRRVFMIERYMDTTRSSLECLREVSLLMPPGVDLVWFRYIKGEAAGGSVSGDGVMVKMEGEAGTVDQVYDFKAKLDASALFKEATLQGPRTDKARNKQIFNVDLQVRGGNG